MIMKEGTNSAVRMLLNDYDAAPDGCGTYTKLDAGFESVSAALQYRDRFLSGMYWGAVYNLRGDKLVELLERYEGPNYRIVQGW